MPHSYQGRVRVHPQEPDRFEVSHATIVNRDDGSRTTYEEITTVPRDASSEAIAAAFGEVARLSILAAMRNG